MRSIRAIGYDMDYTLVHYNVDRWEERAYQYIKAKLLDRSWPVADLEFDKSLMVRGLIIDTRLGNVVKANRFGYVKRAFHGTTPMGFDDQRKAYARTLVDLKKRNRFIFLNTLFSLSEACIYAQLVDLLDRREFPEVLGYADLYRSVRSALDESHAEGQLKGEIIQDPDRFVEDDPETALALLDQKNAGKRLALITNSDWHFSSAMMDYTFDKHLPGDMTWRDLFELVIVDARKPAFFKVENPAYEVDHDSGLLRPMRELKQEGVFSGGNAAQVEKYLGLSGDEILYVGDHVWGDVKASKVILRWRTAMVLRELESDIMAESEFAPRQRDLEDLMAKKAALETRQYECRLELQRKRKKYGPRGNQRPGILEKEIESLRQRMQELDEEIAPLARAASEISNPNWGLLMRAGNDKSHLARQVERSADIYMSRVSNFLYQTPFVYLRSSRGSLPHDQV
jgi:HAD superfamily 5'-nucleotidase-like hydrolase